MEPGKWAQVLEMIESESRALNQAEAPSTPQSEIDVEVAPLVQKLGTTSIAEVEKMIEELQEARDFLQAERVQRETEHSRLFLARVSMSFRVSSFNSPSRCGPSLKRLAVVQLPVDLVHGRAEGGT